MQTGRNEIQQISSYILRSMVFGPCSVLGVLLCSIRGQMNEDGDVSERASKVVSLGIPPYSGQIMRSAGQYLGTMLHVRIIRRSLLSPGSTRNAKSC